MQDLTRPPEPPLGHFYELDSLRGAAAAVVVFWHFTIGFARPWLQHLTLGFPERLLFSGRQSVILFFVLSGFVLTQPALRGKQPPYIAFLLKRFVRIYVPYLGALLLALAADALLHGSVRQGAAWTEVWANSTWTDPVNASLVAHQVLFLGDYDWGQVNTAFWSLVFELRISIIFPLLLIAVLRLRVRWLLLCAAVLMFDQRAASLIGYAQQDATTSLISSTLLTLHYAAMFLLGSLLARHLPLVSALYARLSRLAITAVALVALLLYDGLPARHAVPTPLGGKPAPPGAPHDWVVTAGSLLVIALALHLGPLQRALRHRAIHHLGKLSYSLYLVHATVLFALMHLLPAGVNIALAASLYLVATMALTEALYRLVELPAIRASKRVGRRTTHLEAELLAAKPV